MRYTVRPISDRTAFTGKHEYTPFRASWTDTLDLLGRELDHLKATEVVLELDIIEGNLRLDGMLRADAKIASPAVRIAFASKVRPLVYGTDRYTGHYHKGPADWQENVRAIALGLEALRKVDRYGITKSGEQYAGWKQLPAGSGNGASHMTHDEALAVVLDLTPPTKRRSARASRPLGQGRSAPRPPSGGSNAVGPGRASRTGAGSDVMRLYHNFTWYRCSSFRFLTVARRCNSRDASGPTCHLLRYGHTRRVRRRSLCASNEGDFGPGANVVQLRWTQNRRAEPVKHSISKCASPRSAASRSKLQTPISPGANPGHGGPVSPRLTIPPWPKRSTRATLSVETFSSSSRYSPPVGPLTRAHHSTPCMVWRCLTSWTTTPAAAVAANPVVTTQPQSISTRLTVQPCRGNQ